MSGPAVARPAAEVAGWVRAVFVAAGLGDDDAGTLTDSLMFAERRGVSSHGLSRMPVYVGRIAAGSINPRPRLQITHRGAVATVAGDDGPGAIVAAAATGEAIRLAGSHGVGLAVARDLGHAGAMGFYADRIARRGLVGLVAGNADPIMVPPGGRTAALGSNPLAIGLPETAAGDAPLLDMATTAAAHGKIVMAQIEGRSIPAGWAVDGRGQETTDPAAALGGALLPAAGPKGYGLAFMIDALCAGLSGGRTGTDITPLYEQLDQPQRACVLVLAIDPGAAAGAERLDRAVTETATAVRGAGGSPLLPGEPERRRSAASGDTVTLPAAVAAEMAAAAARVQGPPAPWGSG